MKTLWQGRPALAKRKVVYHFARRVRLAALIHKVAAPSTHIKFHIIIKTLRHHKSILVILYDQMLDLFVVPIHEAHLVFFVK